uniref:RRM domain-containing protein n=1 Tax=Chlorocebus sabaeus TaxID=60711 RepID=A0A0D9S0D4_CHLSB
VMEVNQPGKLFIGGLSREANEKTLKAVFGKHGPLSEVVWKKDRKNKCRGFAFITFENPADAKNAAKDMNGKFLYGKAIKVEQANKPSFQSGGTRRIPPPSRRRSPLGSLRSTRSSGGTRGRHHSRGGHLGDGGYTLDLHTSSSMGKNGVKRGPSSRIGSPPPKKSAPSTVARSNDGMGGQGPMSRGRESYAGPLRREPFSSWRNDSMSPRDDAYAKKDFHHSKLQLHYQLSSPFHFLPFRSRQDSSLPTSSQRLYISSLLQFIDIPVCGKHGITFWLRNALFESLIRSISSPYFLGCKQFMFWIPEVDHLKFVSLTHASRNHPSFRDTRCYAPPRKDYAWCDYGRSHRDEHSSRGYGEHDGRGKDDSEHPSRCSYRDAYQSYWTSRGAPPAPAPRMTFGGSSHHDYNNTRDRYDRSRESYSRSRGDFYSSGREHGGRKERTYPPSVDRVCRDPHEEYGSSSHRASRKGVGGRRSGKGD